MIINADDEIIMGNKAENTKFKIATSAKAFKILSSGLYKNKIRAVVRELSCNCLDAHKLNGFTGQFEIKVPGQMDPRFVIRDFGPGLSKEDVENLYTTYFASTKNQSNDFIGALGLGSKSPFSYTETFTVTSYHGGMVRGYTAMLDKGEPVIRPIFEEPMTDEDKTGIEIVVPVKIGDIDRWREEIRYVLRPIGANKVALVGSTMEIDFFPEFDEYLALETQGYGHFERSGMWAIYGNIVYPLQNIPGMPQTWLQARHGLVYIRFPLGELDIAASREELSLDEDTIANIKSRVIALDKKSMEEDLKEWRESDNTRKVFREVSSLSYTATNMIQGRRSLLTSKGLTFDTLKRMYDIPSSWTSAGVVYEVCVDPKLKRIKSSSNSSQVSLNRLFGINTKKLTIVIDDNKKGRLPALRALNNICYSASHNEKHAKLLKDNPWLPKRGAELLFVNPESEFEMDLLPSILQKFEGDEVVMLYTSEIFNAVEDEIVVVKREYEPRPKAASCTRYTLVNGDWKTEELFMTASEAEEIEGYVVFAHNTSVHFMNKEHGFVNNSQASVYLSLARDMGVTEVHQVRPTLHKKILKIGNCQCLLSAIYDKFIELIDEVDYDYYTYNSGRAHSYTRHIDKFPELGFMNDMLNEAGKSTDESKALMRMYSWIRSQSIHTATDNYEVDRFRQATHIVNRLQSFAETRSTAKVKKFEAENLIVSEFMRNHWNLEKEQVAEIVKLLGH